MLEHVIRRSQCGAVTAILLLALPASLTAQKGTGPTGIAVTGTAASATVTWEPVAGALSYSVKRWKQDDLRCCNNAVGKLGKPTWIDYGVSESGFPQSGTYVFEVGVVLDNNTTGASQFLWTRPDPVAATLISPPPPPTLTVNTLPTLSLAAPAGVVIRNDVSALVFNWQPVYGATGYQIDTGPAVDGPWTPLVPAPIAITQFAYTPVPATLMYYRVSAAHSLAVSATSTIVPFVYEVPLNPLGVSGTQSGSNVTVAWNPVPGADAYTATASLGLTQVGGLEAHGTETSATFVGVVSPLTTSNDYLLLKVVAHFPPSGAPGVDVPHVGTAFLIINQPSTCWPAAGELPPTAGQTLAAPIASAGGMTLTWPMSGQVIAYRVDRALAGSGQWIPLACLRPGAGSINSGSRTATSSTTTFQDASIALQPSTAYQYRITALGPADATGKRLTYESIVTGITSAKQTLVVGAVVGSNTTGRYVQLSWQTLSAGTKNVLIRNSYGDRRDAATMNGGFSVGTTAVRFLKVPSGTHTFAVTPVYVSGTPAATTTISVIVP
jgi:hypothetical protein